MKRTAASVGRAVWRGLSSAANTTRAKLGRTADRPPPWEADLLDDFAFNRPWNLAIKATRVQARLRCRSLRPGVTVIIVNWNTLAVLQDTLHAVRALTDDDVVIRVIDNGSTDGSREWLQTQSDLQVTVLPTNAGHPIALDLAVLTCRTDIAVALDSDAVPLSTEWIAAVEDPVRTSGAILAGTRSKRNFVHPMLMAIDVEQFVKRRLTFQLYKLPGVDNHNEVWGENAFDTGEWMSRMVERHDLIFLDTTENPVDGLPGMTVGNVVYHHGGVTRMAGAGMDPDSYQQWRDALESILPPTALAEPRQ